MEDNAERALIQKRSLNSELKLRSFFKGCDLVSSLLAKYPQTLISRAEAYRHAERLYRLGHIVSVLVCSRFEDSDSLYKFNNRCVDISPYRHPRINYDDRTKNVILPKEKFYAHRYRGNRGQTFSGVLEKQPYNAENSKTRKPIYRIGNPLQSRRKMPSIDNRESSMQDLTSQALSYQDRVNRNTQFQSHLTRIPPYQPNPSTNLQNQSLSSSMYSSQTVSTSPDRQRAPSNQRTDFAARRTESADEGIGTMRNTDFYLTSTNSNNENRAFSAIETIWPPDNRAAFADNCSFSDNEKQLMEEMTRMKKEHQHILKTYEERINKLMTKMHELRSIAEMLEHSSTKASPHTSKTVANALIDSEKPLNSSVSSYSPPPLPPRPPRSKVVPNKPVLVPTVKLKSLEWNRIILPDLGTPGSQLTIWHTMTEPSVRPDKIQSLFAETKQHDQADDTNLYSDVMAQKGYSREQVTLIETEKFRFFMETCHHLKLTIDDVCESVGRMSDSFLDQDGADIILDLVLSKRDMDRVQQHVKRTGSPSQLDVPEYLMYEMSRVEYCREKAEYLRFQHRLHDYIYDIDQQLKDIRTACEEICSSIHLKNLLETLLAIGNHLNGSTDRGQADGFSIDILTKLKHISDQKKGGNLLEYLLKRYSEEYMAGVTRFSFPEPAHMRHAAQVSLEEIDGAITDLDQEYAFIKQTVTPVVCSNLTPVPPHVKDAALSFFARVNGKRERRMCSSRLYTNVRSGIHYRSNIFSIIVVTRESLDGQRQHFRETREHFLRTAAYFMFAVDSHQSNSKAFFQIWANFLHDCKHYWKNIQRQVSRGAFKFPSQNTIEKSTKSPVDATVTGSDSGTNTSNNKITAKHDIDDTLDEVDSDRTRDRVRPPSPKHITSEPPDSHEIYRPIPTPPKPETVSPIDMDKMEVYGNRSVVEGRFDLTNRDDNVMSDSYYGTTSANSDYSTDSKVRNNSGQKKGPITQPRNKGNKSFFKALLNSANARPKYSGSDKPDNVQNEPSRNGKFPSLSKFRNTMAQKLSLERSPRQVDVKNPVDKVSEDDQESVSDKKQPILNEDIYPANIHNLEVTADTDRLDVTLVENSTENIAQNNTLNYRNLIPNNNQVNDVNNNNNCKVSTTKHPTNPIGINSPMYDRLYGHKNMVSPNTYGSMSSNQHVSLSDTEGCRSSRSAPVYNAKIINTYENQNRFKQQHPYRSGSSDNLLDLDRQYEPQEVGPDYIPMKYPMYAVHSADQTVPPKPTRSVRSDKHRNSPRAHVSPTKTNVPFTSQGQLSGERPPYIPPRVTKSTEMASAMPQRSINPVQNNMYRNRNPSQEIPRNAAHMPNKSNQNRSVGSLIERFEKPGPAEEIIGSNNELEYNAHRGDFQDDSMAMTSTPVSRRKTQQLSVYSDQNQNYPTPALQQYPPNSHISPQPPHYPPYPNSKFYQSPTDTNSQRPYNTQFTSPPNPTQNPFPLLDSVSQTARSSGSSHQRASDHVTYLSNNQRPSEHVVSNHQRPSEHVVSSFNHPRPSPERQIPQSNHSALNRSPNDGGYRDQLRRVAKSKAQEQYGQQPSFNTSMYTPKRAQNSPMYNLTPNKPISVHSGVTV